MNLSQGGIKAKQVTIEAFTKNMQSRIVRAWWLGSVRWKHGIIKKLPGGNVAVCLKDGKVRDIITNDEIVQFNLMHKELSPI